MPFRISVLIYLRNAAGDLLLLERAKAPNRGLWSPIGGKLEMVLGESPFEAAVRETREEIGFDLATDDLHLFGMVSEKAYEGQGHWLMFLFTARTPLRALPPVIDEGRFAFVAESALATLPVPDTDRQILWPLYRERRERFTALRIDCASAPGKPLAVTYEQRL